LPVSFFSIEEVTLVEAAERCDGFTTKHQCGADEEATLSPKRTELQRLAPGTKWGGKGPLDTAGSTVVAIQGRRHTGTPIVTG
jgi:hypothetical protein